MKVSINIPRATLTSATAWTSEEYKEIPFSDNRCVSHRGGGGGSVDFGEAGGGADVPPEDEEAIEVDLDDFKSHPDDDVNLGPSKQTVAVCRGRLTAPPRVVFLDGGARV